MGKTPTTLIIMDGFGLTQPGPGRAVQPRLPAGVHITRQRHGGFAAQRLGQLRIQQAVDA